MKLYDCVTFFQELDLLELRLSELAPVIDRFVIVEATRTHKGDAKPLHYAENKARFAEWEDKIEHVIVGDMPTGDGLAAIRRREMFQRNCILRGLRFAADDDIVFISDCDEIPRPSMLVHEMPDGAIVTYLQKLYYYNFNTLAPDRPWPGTRACRVADARCLSPHIIRNGMGQPDAHYPTHYTMQDGGWHYSYFGGTEKIREKQTQFLHQELVTEENTRASTIRARVASGVDIWGRKNEQSFVIGPADDLPYTVLRDPMHYAAHFAEAWQPVFHEDWYDGGQALFMGQLAREAPKDGAVVEIGCWEGRSSVVLAQMVAPRKITCVDHWRGNVDEDPDHESAEIARERDVLGAFVGNMERLTADNWDHCVADWREWVAAWDQPIAFLHLDASHDRASVRDCLTAVRPFLVDGAVLCGDDAYDANVMAGVRDVFPGAEIVGKRLWRWVHHA